jgi:hypothetical protein
VKIDFDGNIIWENCFGGNKGEISHYISNNSNGDYTVIGYTKSNDGDVSGNHGLSEFDTDIWIFNINSEGELLWQKCFGGQGSEATPGLPFGVIKKSDNNFVLAAQTDFGPSYDVACAPHGGYGDEDWWVFEIGPDDTTGAVENYYEKNMVTVKPNPATDWVAFDYSMNDDNAAAHIKITDVAGKPVTIIPVTDRQGQKIWDTRKVSPGIYFYNFSALGVKKSGKIVVSK